MEQLPPTAEDNDTVRPYWVKELVLDTVYTAALSMRDPDRQSHLPNLFSLDASGKPGGGSDAVDMVPSCFTEASDTAALAATYSALGEIEEELGRRRRGSSSTRQRYGTSTPRVLWAASSMPT